MVTRSILALLMATTLLTPTLSWEAEAATTDDKKVETVAKKKVKKAKKIKGKAKHKQSQDDLEEIDEDHEPSLDIPDPFEPVNRVLFGINEVVDGVVLRPVCLAYENGLPETLRDSVTSFLSNLLSPVTFLNHLLQGRPDHALETVGRFVVNSTIGIGGLFDVANNMDLKKRDTGFDDTLAVWGLGSGPYIFVPVLGPTTFRGAVGQTADYFADPIYYYYNHKGRKHRDWTYVRSGMTVVDTRYPLTKSLDSLKEGSSDYYASIRGIYFQKLQHRYNELKKNATN